jgi:hypothetical protein
MPNTHPDLVIHDPTSLKQKPLSQTIESQILPFVLGTPFTRGSRVTASCNAFAKALKIASIW